MTEPAQLVNDETQRFLSRFNGPIFIRLIHTAYDPKTHEPDRLKPRHFYGPLPEVMDWLNRLARRLNDGSTDDLKFNVYYVPNDPAGHSLVKGSVARLRAIYQDCDEPELALLEPELSGIPAHAVIESSPGKRQRIWYVSDPGIDAHRAKAVHDHMCARHHHDPSTHGAERLLRLPGFRNWKYDDGPVARLVAERPGSISPEQIADAFGFKTYDQYANNIQGAMQNAQKSGNLPNHNVVKLDKERAKRAGIIDRDADAERRDREAKDRTAAQIDTSLLLNTLSLFDPDGSRAEWRTVIAALDYMAGDLPWGKQIAELWSMYGTTKYNQRSFLEHWNGLDRTIEFPANWQTLLRLTAGRRPNKETRALRLCPAFKRFEEEHGPSLDYHQIWFEYPVLLQTPIGDSTFVWRPDQKARRNVAYLLAAERIEVFFDRFAGAAMYSRDGKVAEIDQQLIMELYSTAHATDFRVDDGFLAKQVEALALDQKRDPVERYFENLPPWDETERISTVLQRTMGAPDTPSVRETILCFMVAMVRRTFKPGTKFDMMPILEGKQGLGKSSFFRVLMPNPEWFGEGPKMNEESKRLLSMLGGKLVIEFAELAGMSKQNIDGIKKLITQQTDEYIANFARKKTRAPRRCVFVGSVNGTQYLRDLTDNRRFPIVPVTKELDYAALIAERDQLWAEALMAENFMGEIRLSPEAEADMKAIQEDRLDVNSETTQIMNEIRCFKEGYMSVETIWARIGIGFDDRAKRTGHLQYLFKEIKDLMERDGWQWNKALRVGDEVQRCVFKRRRRGRLPAIVLHGGSFAYATTPHDADEDDEDPDLSDLF